MQLRERLFKKIELMNNDNAIFEISKLKCKSHELPIPLYQKAQKIVLHSFKSLIIQKDKPFLCEKIKDLFKDNIIKVKKMFIAIFWIYMASKFQTIEMPEEQVESLREYLNKNYMQFYMIISKKSIKLRESIVNMQGQIYYQNSLPFFMGEAIKYAMELRLKNGKNLLSTAEQNQLYSIMFKELLGISCSLEFVQQYKEKILVDANPKTQIASQAQQQQQALQRTKSSKKSILTRLNSQTISEEQSKRVDLLSRELIQIFERDNSESILNQNTRKSNNIGRNLQKINLNAQKPPIPKKVNVEKENQAKDKNVEFYVLTSILKRQSLSESKSRKKERFNIFQCSPMFQNSKEMLGADSIVNKVFGINHVIADHNVSQKEPSQILFNKFLSDNIKQKRSRSQRKKALRGMSILKRINFQLAPLDTKSKLSKPSHQNTLLNHSSPFTPYNVAKSQTLMPENTGAQFFQQQAMGNSSYQKITQPKFFDRRGSFISMNQNNYNTIQLEKQRPRFFKVENELNADGSFKKSSKIRQNLKQSTRVLAQKPPQNSSFLLNDGNGIPGQQGMFSKSMMQKQNEFYNPKTTNKDDYVNSFVKTENIEHQKNLLKDLENIQIQEIEYKQKGLKLLNSLESVSQPLMLQIEDGIKQFNPYMNILTGGLKSQREGEKYKGKLLYLNEKRQDKSHVTSQDILNKALKQDL